MGDFSPEEYVEGLLCGWLCRDLEHCLQTKQIRKICVFSRKSLSTDPKITNLRLKKFHKFYSLHKPENKYRIFVLGFIH